MPGLQRFGGLGAIPVSERRPDGPILRKGQGGRRRDRPPAAADARKPAPGLPGNKEGQTEAQDDEKLEAERLARSKGIPMIHALRVVRGETTLNDVLKTLMRKERTARLMKRDGFDRGLAGQVAAGHLSHDRARMIQRIRSVRAYRLDWDAIKVAEHRKEPVAVFFFGSPMQAGHISDVNTYQFMLGPLEPEAGADSPKVRDKHDVKALCPADHAAQVAGAITRDPTVGAMELGGSSERGDRVRPSDELLMDRIDDGLAVRCVLRDGDVFAGRVRSFGRWDVELEIEDGTRVTVLFHALHPSTVWAD